MPKPSVAELRPVVHPAGVKDRRSGEHWAGRLYMREISLRMDRHLVNTRVTPNQLTYLMTVFGVLAAPALLVPGIAGAVLGVLMVQLYLLLDCVDGEVARWKKQFSLGGVYLDRVGAYLCDAAVLVGFGLRAADLWGSGRIDWLWAFLGTLAALGADPDQGRDRPRRRRPPPGRAAAGQGGGVRAALVRHGAGPQGRRGAEVPPAGPRHRGVAADPGRWRSLDTVRGDLFFTRLGVAVLAGIALLQTLLHLVSILASSRLK